MRPAPALALVAATTVVLLPASTSTAAPGQIQTPTASRTAAPRPAAGAAVGAASRAAPTPRITKIRIPPTSSAAPGTPSAGPNARATGRLVASVARSKTRFDVAGVTFSGAAPKGLTVEARTHTRAGWSAWTTLEVTPAHGPDSGTAEARRARPGTEPVTAVGGDGIEVRVLTGGALAPKDLELSLVDAQPSAADATTTATATAITGTDSVARPAIISRAQWGADDSLMPCQPDALGGFKAGVVHHTVNTNTYSSSQAAALVRGIYAFHTQSRGWCDIGYNFLVDRFGRIYEGRKGSLTGFTMGAQAAGFNAETFGVSVIGDFTSSPFPSAVTGAVARTIAWQADRSAFDPSSRVVLTSAGSSRYAAGVKVTLPRVVGHRDLNLTECPGDAAYPQVGGIRSSAAATWRAAQYSVGSGVYVPVTPRRVLDTRSGLAAPRARVPANTSIVLQVPGLPTTATAVTLNVTAVAPSRATYVAAYPASVARRTTSNLNVAAGRVVAAQVVVGVAPGGAVRLYNAHGTVDLVADLSGYFRTGTGPGYVASGRPTRIIDTRTGVGAPAARLPAGRTLTFAVPGLPSATRAVTLNLTAAGATGTGNLVAYQAGRPRPGVSSLNVSGTLPIANLVTVPVDSTGRVSIYTTTGVHVLVDLAGAYADGRGARFVAVSPRRIVDSRLGWGAAPAPLPPGSVRTLAVPAAGPSVVGAAQSVTAISSATSYVTVYRPGQSPPGTSTLNTVAARPVSNLGAVATGGAGAFAVYNRSGSTHVLADLMGIYTS